MSSRNIEIYDSLVNDFLEELQWRGLLNQVSDRDGLAVHLAEAPRRAYIGLDPTADSLTIGNLVALMLLAHFQRAGHEPVVIAGGGTGLIGDPGGKSAERPLLPIEAVRSNVESQRRIYNALLPGAPVVNNADWLEKLSYIEVLRDIGKHFSVNEMVKRDSVRLRLESDGISYTEFSYMLLQSYDFAHLYKTMNVTLQMGGSDQWGNLVSGVDLIRRLHKGQAFALTCPLLTKADGGKFGKSEAGAIWLTADRTSPYAFHQFWLNTDDADVVRYLKIFTFLTREEIAQLEAEVATNSAGRVAQRTLANVVTSMLHGADAATRAEQAGKALFTGEVASLDQATLREVFADVPTAELSQQTLATGYPIEQFLIDAKIAKSNREVREWLEAGAISINGTKVAAGVTLGEADVLDGWGTLARRGKKNWTAVRWI